MPHAAEMTHESQIAIRARGLSIRYGHRIVVNNLDLDVRPGERVWLRGANGSGKTTLLRCLAGLMCPASGHVLWFGERAANRPAMRRRIGMVAHESRIYADLSLRENLLFAARLYGVGQPHQSTDRLLAELSLADHADCMPNEVSRGMQQRLSLARAFVHQPLILLLDEPFAGLDAQGCCWLREKLSVAGQRGQSVCLVTHEQELADYLVDRIFDLGQGRIVETDNSFRNAQQRAVREHAA